MKLRTLNYWLGALAFVFVGVLCANLVSPTSAQYVPTGGGVPGITANGTLNGAFSSCCGGTSLEHDFVNGNEIFSASQGFAFADGTNLEALIKSAGGGIWLARGISVCGSNVCGGANLLISQIAPTISSGFGTSPSIASNNGTASFTINVGTGGTATTGTIGLTAATNGWNCQFTDITTNSATVFLTKQTGAGTTTTVPIGNFNTSGAAAAWVASDIINAQCFAR